MKVFDLDFIDGKFCRCIVMEPLDDEDADKKGVQSIFHPGYVTGMRRIIAPPPEKLPWKRSGDVWHLHRFELRKLYEFRFALSWPGGSLEGSKEEISAAVRRHWSEAV